MQRSQAIGTVKAAVRLKLIAQRARQRREEEEALLNAENGYAESIGGESQYTPSIMSTVKQLSRQVSLDSLHDPAMEAIPWWKRDYLAMKDYITSSYFSILLICCPLGVVAGYLEWPSVAVFLLNFLSLVPLALILGDITEDLAERFGAVIGGLLNATFGNVVEMILSIAALQKNLYTVVAASLLGSILSNLLLVLGCCFLFGGLKYKTQTFNAIANKATSSLLFVSAIGIMIPYASTHMIGDEGQKSDWVLSLSRGTALVLLILYICYLVFQLKTHRDIFCEEEDGEHGALMTLPGALTALGLVTVVVAVNSEYLTGSIEDFSKTTGLGQAFLGMIILPIAGNACEHITAVIVAYKNKMDLALGVAVGSSIQIAIFAIPFVVLVAWAEGLPFSLDFDGFSVLALAVSVIHANFVTADATSHWLMGVQLIATYLLIALAFLYR